MHRGRDPRARTGYRHIDTARAYENEAEVGRAIEESPVHRDDVFVTTKLWITEFEPDALRGATEDSLRKLRVDAVDLLPLHWPGARARADRHRPGRVPPVPRPGPPARGGRRGGPLHHRVLAAPHGEVGDDQTLRGIGEAHGKTADQVALRYLLDIDRVAVLPKFATASRREENFDVLDFELTPEDRRRIDELPKDDHQIDPRSLAPDWDA